MAAIASPGVEGVLETEETAFLEMYAVACNETGNGLPDGTCGVLEDDVFGIEVGAVDVDGGGTGCAFVFSEDILFVCIVVV